MNVALAWWLFTVVEPVPCKMLGDPSEPHEVSPGQEDILDHQLGDALTFACYPGKPYGALSGVVWCEGGGWRRWLLHRDVVLLHTPGFVWEMGEVAAGAEALCARM